MLRLKKFGFEKQKHKESRDFGKIFDSKLWFQELSVQMKTFVSKKLNNVKRNDFLSFDYWIKLLHREPDALLILLPY